MENSMRLKRSKNILIWDFIGSGINSREFDMHIKYIKKLKKYDTIHINIAHLSDIDNDTLNKFHRLHALLKNKHVCIINVNPINNVVLNLFKIDKMFQLYLTKEDALDGRNPIINRKFKLVS